MNINEPTAGGTVLRPATVTDITSIHAMLERSAEIGELLSRPSQELYSRVMEFVVVEAEDEIVGCGALEVFTDELGEVRSLLVDARYRGGGLGRKIVTHLAGAAQALGLRRLMALTYVPGFFHRLGFDTVEIHTLPEKVWGVCVKCPKFQRCDEIAVVRYLNHDQRAG